MTFFIGATTKDSTLNAATYTLALPAGSAANMFAYVFHGTASSTVAEFTATGWTKVFGAAAGNMYASALYKKLDSTDIATGSITVTRGTSGDNAPIWLLVFDTPLTALDASVSLPLSSSQYSVRGSSVATTVAPAVTPTSSGTALVICLERTLATGTTSSFSAGTKVYDSELNAVGNVSLSVAELATTAGVSTGTVTVTANSASGNGIALMIPMVGSSSVSASASATVTAGGTLAASIAYAAAAAATVTAGGTTTPSQIEAAAASATVTAGGSATVGGLQTAAASSTVTAGGTAAPATVYGTPVSSTVTASGALTARTDVAVAISSTVTASGTLTSTKLSPVDVWIANTPMYAAHRGGSDDWPEETMYAYAQAAAWNPDLALEISVWQCSTGEWVCSHDQTTGRMFGTNYDITTTPWSTLSTLRTTVGNQPICKLTDVLDLYGNTRILFIDNKGSQSVTAFFNLLDSYAGARRYIIKQYCTGNSVPTEAHNRGYKTWGYYYQADVAVNLPATQSRWDLLGMDYTADGPSWTAVLSYGKKVIAHIINSSAAATTAFGEGAVGLMASKVTQAVPNTGFVSSATVTASGTTVARIDYTGLAAGTIVASGSLSAATKANVAISATVKASGAVSPSTVGGNVYQGWGLLQI